MDAIKQNKPYKQINQNFNKALIPEPYNYSVTLRNRRVDRKILKIK
jgi:hypothetical protein